MWRLFRELKIRRGYTVDYYGCSHTASDELPLDPIEEDLAGCFRWRCLLEEIVRRDGVGMGLARRVLETCAADLVERETQSHFPRVKPEYNEHMRALIACHILKRWGSVERAVREGIMVSKYFAIEKTEKAARAIMNAKIINRLSAVAPPVNLTPYRMLLQLIQEFGIYFYTFDMRHFFHQYGLKGPNKFFLCYRNPETHKDEILEWATLPMGYSNSLFICQATAYLLTMFRPHGSREKEVFSIPSQFREACGPPDYLHILNKGGDIVGAVSITYDNFGFICKCRSTMDHVIRIMKRNVTMWGARKKPGSEMQWDLSSGEVAEFLGLQFRGLGTRLEWRIDETRMERWRSLTNPQQSLTCRQFAAYAGRILRSNWIAMEPLFRAGGAIGALQECARVTIGDIKKWDSPVALPEKVLQRLVSEWDNALCNSWRTKKLTNTSEPDDSWYLFTDASTTHGWGGCVVNKHGEVVWQLRRPTKDEHQHWSIFTREVAAVCWCWKLVAELFPRITVYTDNAAGRLCLERGFSSNNLAQDFISDIFEYNDLHDLIWDIRWIPGDINPADSLSHLNAIIPTMITKAMNFIHKGTLLNIGNATRKRDREGHMMEEIDTTLDDSVEPPYME